MPESTLPPAAVPRSYHEKFSRYLLKRYHDKLGLPELLERFFDVLFGGTPREDLEQLLLDAVVKQILPMDVDKTPFTVGIVGAGAAGLYSAMILQDLGVDFEILEAQRNHIGGRLLTHHFSDGPNDYYVSYFLWRLVAFI
jgi:hypothetical protein